MFKRYTEQWQFFFPLKMLRNEYIKSRAQCGVLPIKRSKARSAKIQSLSSFERKGSGKQEIDRRNYECTHTNHTVSTRIAANNSALPAPPCFLTGCREI